MTRSTAARRREGKDGREDDGVLGGLHRKQQTNNGAYAMYQTNLGDRSPEKSDVLFRVLFVSRMGGQKQMHETKGNGPMQICIVSLSNVGVCVKGYGGGVSRTR